MLKFTKMHGAGNDFVLIDATEIPINLDIAQIKFLADRKYGVGCDQVLIVENTIDANADFNYRIFNPDGNEVEHCGNGARCVIEYLYTHKTIAKSEIKLKTKTRIITGTKNHNGISIGMGKPQFLPSEIPFTHSHNSDDIYNLNINNETITCGVISMGNPHAIIQLNNTAELNNLQHLEHIAKSLQSSDYFPESINVNFFSVIDKNNIQIITYERGCGFTLACGTGACATVCYGIMQNLLSHQVCVNAPGGKLKVSWDKVNEVILQGPAVAVFEGHLCN